MNNILQMVKSANNPQAFLMNMIQQQYGNNPIMRNVLQMASSNNTQGIENIARNLCRERGVNADELFNTIANKCR